MNFSATIVPEFFFHSVATNASNKGYSGVQITMEFRIKCDSIDSGSREHNAVKR